MIDFKNILTPFGGTDATINYRPGSNFPWQYIKGGVAVQAETFPGLMDKIKDENPATRDYAQESFIANVDAFLHILVQQRDLLQDIVLANIQAAKSPIAGRAEECLKETIAILKKAGFTDRELKA